MHADRSAFIETHGGQQKSKEIFDQPAFEEEVEEFCRFIWPKLEMSTERLMLVRMLEINFNIIHLGEEWEKKKYRNI